ncbi:hypothetical protein [Paenibacillus arenilitoris]|uniref:Uncharacterized protein n=1 Tax=Paenibacillus arenilitoris TaxID=2772299 RepID=A0A927CNL4_9BACL|nr:hypothetical protein [Paenibacillus arenilitoris]MBD2870612.1 hypothetical protein [Paenibacillus arenilitoris]
MASTTLSCEMAILILKNETKSLYISLTPYFVSILSLNGTIRAAQSPIRRYFGRSSSPSAMNRSMPLISGGMTDTWPSPSNTPADFPATQVVRIQSI